MEIGTSIGTALGPVLAGTLFDITQSYTSAFVYAALATLMTAVLLSSVKKETGSRQI